MTYFTRAPIGTAETYQYVLGVTKYNNLPIETIITIGEEGLLGYIIAMYAMLGGSISDLSKSSTKLEIEDILKIYNNGRTLDISGLLRNPSNKRILLDGEAAFETDESEFNTLGRRWNRPYAFKLSGQYGFTIIQFDTAEFMEGVKRAVTDLGLDSNVRSGGATGGIIGPTHIKAM